METLVEEVHIHDSQITELNSNDAMQDEKISALETALNGNKTTVLSKVSPLDRGHCKLSKAQGLRAGL